MGASLVGSGGSALTTRGWRAWQGRGGNSMYQLIHGIMGWVGGLSPCTQGLDTPTLSGWLALAEGEGGG